MPPYPPKLSSARPTRRGSPVWAGLYLTIKEFCPFLQRQVRTKEPVDKNILLVLRYSPRNFDCKKPKTVSYLVQLLPQKKTIIKSKLGQHGFALMSPEKLTEQVLAPLDDLLVCCTTLLVKRFSQHPTWISKETTGCHSPSVSLGTTKYSLVLLFS